MFFSLERFIKLSFKKSIKKQYFLIVGDQISTSTKRLGCKKLGLFWYELSYGLI